MKIIKPESKTVLFETLNYGDFFLYRGELFRKTDDVICVNDASGVIFNAMMFDEYDEEDIKSFEKNAEVIPVNVEIKVKYK